MNERKNIFLTVFFSAVLLGLVLSQPGNLDSTNDFNQIKNVDLGDNKLSLSTLCYTLNIEISDRQTSILKSELQNKDFDRPRTHELVMRAADRRISHVEIYSMENNTYYADLVIGNLFQERIDVRPSDGVLLASSNDVPIMIDKNLIRENGVNQCLGGSIEI